ncbi:CvpA family protein [Cytobacillus sp. IB215665]|uniref:CvpA family protein n=1 Tax=Cytobacillus sp. IB215665 TaxID=3097357 RepID=UPI002A0BB75C|nr:CvpA family protein [Cytobacillus sp. IB215665]MDX8363989.1 CvpA family protein [Cytobacillus sp. IB215665]
MLDLILIIILIAGFLIGLKRGFVLQIIHFFGLIVAFVLASIYYDTLAPKLILWIPYPTIGEGSALNSLFENMNLEDAYYRAIAFVIIFIMVKIIMQIIGSMLDFVANLPILKQINGWAGAILGFLEVYIILFVVLYIVALLPIDFIQMPIQDSFVANMMIKHTPIFSSMIKDLWFEYVAG